MEMLLIVSIADVIPHLLFHHHLIPPHTVLVVGGKAKTQGVSFYILVTVALQHVSLSWN